jgi:DNA-binding transcriptional LysR family regulator
MTLNLSNIKYFCDTVRLGSVSRAAKANFVTQSAISQGISKLETSLGVSLHSRHPNRFRLTPEGDMAFQKSIAILQAAGELKDSISNEKTAGPLEFASTYSFALAVIPEYLKKFRIAFPDVPVNFSIEKTESITQKLKIGAIDFGIVPDEIDLSGFEARPIYSGKFGLYAARHLSRKEREKLSFIIAEPDCKDTHFFRKAYRKKFGRSPPVTLCVSSWEVIANLTQEGLGIGYFPDYIAKKRAASFCSCDLGIDLFRYRFCAIFPKGMTLRKSSQIFLSYFRDG